MEFVSAWLLYSEDRSHTHPPLSPLNLPCSVHFPVSRQRPLIEVFLSLNSVRPWEPERAFWGERSIILTSFLDKVIDRRGVTVLSSLVFSRPLPTGEGKRMDEEKKSLWKNLGMISTMGISFAVAIAIGVYVGLKLDQWLGTKPWFFFIFLFFGIVAGFRNIFILAGQELRNDGDQDKRR